MNNNKQTLESWRDRIESALDYRPDDKTYRVAREIFTDRELFDLEMELIFENTWIFCLPRKPGCHPQRLFHHEGWPSTDDHHP